MVLSSAKIGTKLYSGFGVVLVLMVIIAATGITRLSTVNETVDNIVKNSNVKVSLLMTCWTISISLPVQSETPC